MRTFPRQHNYITQGLQFLYVNKRNSPPVKTNIMQQDKTILSLTTDLLANGGFNHLKDEEISALHHLLLRLQEPLSIIQQNLLLRFWSNADAANIPPALLYRCNAILQQRGLQPIEESFVAVELY
jgi:hypothetical protein